MDRISYYGHDPNSSQSSSLANYGKEEEEKKKKKGNSKRSKVVKLSTDPQSVAARERRHRISDRFKILQSLVPGGTKMDTVSMLEQAIHYVKFLKTQLWLHQTMINFRDDDPSLFLPPTSLPAQQSLYSPVKLVAHEIPPSPPLGLLEYSHFQGEETMPFDGSMYY